jgi:hypothetical protein
MNRRRLAGTSWLLASYQTDAGQVPAAASPASLTFGPAGAFTGAGTVPVDRATVPGGMMTGLSDRAGRSR